MAKRITLVLGLAGLALIVLAALLYVRISLFRIRQDVSDGYVVEAHDSQSVGQSFSSHYPGLAQISVKLADSATISYDQVVTLYLESPESHNTLTLSKRAQELQEGQWLNFTFEPLDDSQSKNYTFSIWTAGGQPLRLAASQANMYPEGAMVGGGDLVFRVVYDGHLIPLFAAFLSRIAENKLDVYGQRWFYVVLFGVYGLTLVGTSLAMVRAFLSRSDLDPTRKPELMA